MSERPATLLELMQGAGSGDRRRVSALLAAEPGLVTCGLERRDEFFYAEHRAQVYAGDTALHVAAFAHDVDLVDYLIVCGADVGARNRRGAQPLHAAVIGSPGSTNWNPGGQVVAIGALVASRADPNAPRAA